VVKAWKWVIGVVTAIVAALILFGKRSKPKKTKQRKTTSSVARENIKESFDKETKKIQSAVESSAAAESLADLGNARSRK
tara:strand:- start:484 stop:723 length:240 start_codon:yes stop_codon:yes gene_type:complete